MILEFNNQKVERDGITDNENYVTIHYSNGVELNEVIKEISTDVWKSITTLIIWGGHGSPNSICNLTRDSIVEILRQIPHDVQFNTVILDACDSACFANEFVERLANNGIVLCHVGLCRVQTIQEYKENDEKKLRWNWWNLNKNVIDTYGKAVFPAIYRRDSGLTYYYVDGEFENEIEDGLFTKNSLTCNLQIIGEYIKESILQEDRDSFTKDEFYGQNL